MCFIFCTTLKYKKMPSCASCIIAHPEDDIEAQKTRHHVMMECGFRDEPILVRGIKPSPIGVFNSFSVVHSRCLAVMQRMGCSERKSHVLIMEDDCRFVSSGSQSVHDRIEESIQRVDKLSCGTWHSLHLGHVPLGPSVPLGTTKRSKDVIIWSSLPFTGHAYLINYRQIDALVKRWDLRPFNYEGMLSSPVWTRFAVQPAMATQIRRPKELRLIDETIRITALVDFSMWTHIMCGISLIFPLFLVWLVVYVVRHWSDSSTLPL